MGEGKNWKGGLAEKGLLSAGVVLVVVLLALLNYFGWKYHQRLDWTSAELYTLSEKSIAVVRGLERDVEVIVFMRPGGELYDEVTELLARYEAASPRIQLRLLDPERNLAEAQSLVDQYQVTGLDVVVFDAGDGNTRIVQTADLAEYDYSGMQFGQAPTLKGFKGEQQLTSALLNLSESEKPRILLTKGHGEHALDDFSSGGLSAAADYLERENFEVDEWASLGAGDVPADADLVVIAGPTAGLIEPELAALERYLGRGGRLLVLLDPALAPSGGGLVATGLATLLAKYGVTVDDTIVVDPANPLPFFGAETIFANSYGSHPVTQPMQRGELSVILALARSVRPGTAPAGYTASELVRTSAEGWGETDLAALRDVKKDPADVPGPVSLGVAVSRTEPAAEGEAEFMETTEEAPAAEPAAEVAGARLIAFGDSDFVTNAQIESAANAVLFANAFNWLVAREELVAIPPKAPEQVRLSLTTGELRWIFWLSLAILPGAMLALGAWVYTRRRR
jgi:ABC-type uncharacterized transport system involved in gliding motility auxiliary subunit